LNTLKYCRFWNADLKTGGFSVKYRKESWQMEMNGRMNGVMDGGIMLLTSTRPDKFIYFVTYVKSFE
jgi:hypothetical protein